MARRVIVLEKTNENDAVIEFRYAFWLTVPAARTAFYANAAFVSQVTGTEVPSTQELNALRNGTVTERVGTAQFSKINGNGAAKTGAQIIADAKTDLAAGWTAAQAEVTAYNPWSRYGSFWDGTIWTDKTVV